MDDDAHALAVELMRRCDLQDRKIEAQRVEALARRELDAQRDRELEALRQDATVRRQNQLEILDMLRTMGDTCHALAEAADRLTAEL